MSEVLQVPNYTSANILERAVLNADAVAGQASSTWLDVQGFAVENRVVLEPGTEIAEIVTIQSIDSTTKVVVFSATLRNSHYRSSSIIKVLGDNIRLYRAANVNGYLPSDDDYDLLSTTPIEAHKTFTQVADSTGDASYWYKSTYYNSISGDETTLNLSYATRGGGYGHYVSIEDVRLEAGFQNATGVDDSVFAARRDQTEAEVNGRLAAAGYTMPLQTSNGTAYTPPLVENITRLLAAGYMLNQDYGSTTDGDTKNGGEKLKQARKLLDDIQSQHMVLLDTAGAQLARTLQVGGWPDSTTESVGTDGITGEPFQMTMSKQF